MAEIYSFNVNIFPLLRLYRIMFIVGVVALDNIGEKIKCERLKKSLKQYELAKKANISNTYLSDIEVGRTTPSIKTLNKIAKALEIDYIELLK